ncbi:MAG: hypothetical protein DMG65_08670, partial [Candidatus Angelobacter sp. Gp1-AA117]
MKLFHTVFFCLAMSCIAFAQSPDTKLDIPAGVKYKFASDEVNAAAKAVLEKALAGDQAVLKHLLSQSATCGPMLWQTLKPVAGPVLLNTKPMTMIVATPAGVVTESRALASDEARQAFWVALTGKYPQLASAKVRKAKANEISYYWATIPFDIEEPFFAIEAGRDVFIAQIAHDKSKTALFWIDLVGDLKALKPQQPSDATTIDLCINNVIGQPKKEGRSDCTMQPRSFAGDVRMLLIERMTSSINSTTSSGQLLASSR